MLTAVIFVLLTRVKKFRTLFGLNEAIKIKHLRLAKVYLVEKIQFKGKNNRIKQ